MEIEIFEVDTDGYGYRVGNVYQEYHPDFSGFVKMTREEAEELANALLVRLASG